MRCERSRTVSRASQPELDLGWRENVIGVAMVAKDLLTLPLVWKKVRNGLWSTSVRDKACLLRMNNFPQEALYTVMVGDSSLEIDDAPGGWTIEW